MKTITATDGSTVVLPKVPEPIGHFDIGATAGNLLYLSGQGPILENGTLATGKVGHDVDTATAKHHARRTGMVLLAAAVQLLGSPDRIERVVKLLGLVNAVPEFTEHPLVINGCSELLTEVLGQRGRHARSAVGVGSLPGNITVEIEAILEVSD